MMRYVSSANPNLAKSSVEAVLYSRFAGSYAPGSARSETPTDPSGDVSSILESLGHIAFKRGMDKLLSELPLDEEGRAVLKFKSPEALCAEAWYWGTPSTGPTSSQASAHSSPSASTLATEPDDSYRLPVPPRRPERRWVSTYRAPEYVEMDEAKARGEIITRDEASARATAKVDAENKKRLKALARDKVAQKAAWTSANSPSIGTALLMDSSSALNSALPEDAQSTHISPRLSVWLRDPRKPGVSLESWPGKSPLSRSFHNVFEKTTELLETDSYGGIQFLFELGNEAGELKFRVAKGAPEEFQRMKENAAMRLKKAIKDSEKKPTVIELILKPLGLVDVASSKSARTDTTEIEMLFESATPLWGMSPPVQKGATLPRLLLEKAPATSTCSDNRNEPAVSEPNDYPILRSKSSLKRALHEDDANTFSKRYKLSEVG